MGVKLGTLDISSFKVGSADCKVYLGETLLYSGDTPTPPSFQVKWLATYNGGTTSSAECDASSAITQNEIALSNLVEVEIGDCVTSIGFEAFDSCTSLTSVTIPDSVTSIEFEAFYYCTSLTSIDILSSVTNIGGRAFGVCTGLTSIEIPSSVTSIGDMAFRYCTGLTSITVESIYPPTLGVMAFDNSSCPIYVPSASVNAYKAATNWSTYASRIQAIPSPTPTYTWTTIDDTFTSQTPIPVYEIHVDWLTTDDNNQSFGFYDNPSFSGGGYNCTIDYDENSGLYELLINEYPSLTTAYTHSFTSSTDINLDFIAIFGKPMYFNTPPQEMGNCLDEQCTQYDCLEWGCVDWDPDTGECITEDCIQQGDCIDWMCMQYETLYIATAKIIQQN